MSLHRVGAPHPISRRPEHSKKFSQCQERQNFPAFWASSSTSALANCTLKSSANAKKERIFQHCRLQHQLFLILHQTAFRFKLKFQFSWISGLPTYPADSELDNLYNHVSQFLIISFYLLSIYLYTFYCICIHLLTINGLPWLLNNKESACSAGASGDESSIRESGGCPGRGYGNSLQYSCLENPMDKGTWQAIVHGAAKSGT